MSGPGRRLLAPGPPFQVRFLKCRGISFFVRSRTLKFRAMKFLVYVRAGASSTLDKLLGPALEAGVASS